VTSIRAPQTPPLLQPEVPGRYLRPLQLVPGMRQASASERTTSSLAAAGRSTRSRWTSSAARSTNRERNLRQHDRSASVDYPQLYPSIWPWNERPHQGDQKPRQEEPPLHYEPTREYSHRFRVAGVTESSKLPSGRNAPLVLAVVRRVGISRDLPARSGDANRLGRPRSGRKCWTTGRT
jgi:hypothetical protein